VPVMADMSVRRSSYASGVLARASATVGATATTAYCAGRPQQVAWAWMPSRKFQTRAHRVVLAAANATSRTRPWRPNPRSDGGTGRGRDSGTLRVQTCCANGSDIESARRCVLIHDAAARCRRDIRNGLSSPASSAASRYRH